MAKATRDWDDRIGRRLKLRDLYILSDFAVLCANCHRMIHKSNDPSDLSKFREGLASKKS